MSTGLNCQFVEVAPGAWMLVLEEGSAPKQSWDWREYATSYGMFASEEKANEFLHQHFANPGGSCSYPYDPDEKPDPVMTDLISRARANKAALSPARRGRWF